MDTHAHTDRDTHTHTHRHRHTQTYALQIQSYTPTHIKIFIHQWNSPFQELFRDVNILVFRLYGWIFM